jgi:ATP-binding protein involved in chromosome partitioning
MAVTNEAVQAALKDLIDPILTRTTCPTRSARNIKVDGADVSLDIELGYPGENPA